MTQPRLATVGRVSVTWIDLAGAHNVRDLGGLRAGAGATRPNVLLRADALDGLTAADVAELVETRGLAHVVDLRSGHERLERGRGLLGATPVRYTELEVIGPDDLARRAESRAACLRRRPPAGADPRRRVRRAARTRGRGLQRRVPAHRRSPAAHQRSSTAPSARTAPASSSPCSSTPPASTTTRSSPTTPGPASAWRRSSSAG